MFECNNCGHKPQASEVALWNANCQACGDVVSAYTVDVANKIVSLEQEVEELRKAVDLWYNKVLDCDCE